MTRRARRRIAPVAALLVLGAPAAAAQYAAAANVGASVPFTMGDVQVDVHGGVDRHVSWLAPRTVLALGADASHNWGSNGASFGLSVQRSAEVDSLSPVVTIRGGYWRHVGTITLSLDVAAHAVQFGAQPGAVNVTQSWVDSTTYLPAGAGLPDTLAHYRVLRADTVSLPSTPARLAHWSELQAAAAWTRGRVRVDALVGARPRVGAFPQSVWGHVGGSVQVTSGLAIVAAAGVAPTRIGLGIPGSRFLSAGLSIAPRSAAQAAAPPPPRAAPFALQRLDGRRYTVSYAVEHAERVELSGDFDHWAPIALHRTGADRWTATLTLTPGVYHVSLRVDGGPWFAPPGAPAVADDFGGTAGIVVVP